MNEQIDYAEMLEIPVETIAVRKREKKKRVREEDLQEQLVESINDKMAEDDPAYAESRQIAREAPISRKKSRVRAVLIGELVAACALVATIFLTNIFVPDSAINTFVNGLFGNTTQTADTRTYSDFTLSSVVNEYSDATLAVSDTGVLSFTAECSVYPPCEGTVSAVSGDKESGYSVEVRHSDSFSTILSGLDSVYLTAGDKARANLPLGYSNGEGEVRVMFYEEGALLNCLQVSGENVLSWS